MVDIVAGRYIGDKTLEEFVSLYELLTINSQQKPIRGKRVRVHEVNVQWDLGR